MIELIVMIGLVIALFVTLIVLLLSEYRRKKKQNYLKKRNDVIHDLIEKIENHPFKIELDHSEEQEPSLLTQVFQPDFGKKKSMEVHDNDTKDGATFVTVDSDSNPNGSSST